jgi:hypothetical protein
MLKKKNSSTSNSRSCHVEKNDVKVFLTAWGDSHSFLMLTSSRGIGDWAFSFSPKTKFS